MRGIRLGLRNGLQMFCGKPAPRIWRRIRRHWSVPMFSGKLVPSIFPENRRRKWFAKYLWRLMRAGLEAMDLKASRCWSSDRSGRNSWVSCGNVCDRFRGTVPRAF